ncbi:hypothetical protein PSACC_00273 [Paramicrosporidium saccamoebae]|uniref:Uncharacterized protein n=1 Tax=Paramicrosporidium saccamoebae TaxID=1246581 RepID=A0A2H9TQ81_9FUNG|nr:hypothetical protein PSACC_00273 [Paramicrosporidium saccamoebae]
MVTLTLGILLATIWIYTVMSKPLSDTTMDFELFPSEHATGTTAVCFSNELTTKDPITLFKSAQGCAPVTVRSALIRLAEGGSVIGLYCGADDSEPAVAISFVVDIHSPVQLDSLTASYVKDNVHVQVRDGICKDMRFEKVDITRPLPQFFILEPSA